MFEDIFKRFSQVNEAPPDINLRVDEMVGDSTDLDELTLTKKQVTAAHTWLQEIIEAGNEESETAEKLREYIAVRLPIIDAATPHPYEESREED